MAWSREASCWEVGGVVVRDAGCGRWEVWRCGMPAVLYCGVIKLVVIGLVHGGDWLIVVLVLIATFVASMT